MVLLLNLLSNSINKTMARLHLFEFEDQSWFPGFLRNYGTDFLQFLANATRMWKPVVPVLSDLLKKTGQTRIIDLASGGGGGLLWLSQALKEEHPDLKVTLTDFYPNLNAFKHAQSLTDNFDFVETQVNALNVPAELKGLRTQFLSLHHFKPEQARQILQNAVDTKSPIAIFEGQERSFPSVLAMLFSPITLWLTTPFIRPFRWMRLLFSYLIPIVPLFVLWDGIVSALRTYSVKELQALVDGLEDKEQFDWEIKRVKSGPGVVIYLTGVPKMS